MNKQFSPGGSVVKCSFLLKTNRPHHTSIKALTIWILFKQVVGLILDFRQDKFCM